MADECDRAVEAIQRLESTKADSGRRTIDNIMSPIRSMIEEEKTATGARKTELQNKIVSHYAEAGEKEATKEKTDFTTAIKADNSVQTYIQKMGYDDYANFRSEVQRVFGGPQARITEIEFKNAKIPSITTRLQEKGLMTSTINDAFTTMKGEGILSEKNFNQLRELDELADKGLTTIQQGTARQTYKDMKATIGEPITNELFAHKIDNNLAELTRSYSESGLVDKLFRKTPTKDEWELFDKIASGKQIPNGASFEAVQKMLAKISADGWETIRGTIKPLDELDGPGQISVAKEMYKSSLRGKLTSGRALVVDAATIALGPPAALGIWAMWQQTQFENNMQFGKWVDDKSSEGLWNRFLSDDAIEGQRMAKETQQSWLAAYEFITSIPIIGDFYKLQLNAMGSEAQVRGFDNDAKLNIFGPLVDKGMAVEDSSAPWGYSKNTNMDETYKKDPSRLFKNDAGWIKEHTPWKGGSGIYRTGKQGRKLTALEAMALYYYDKGENNVELSKMGLTFDDTGDETTMNMVREFGKENDTTKTPTKTTSETISPKYDATQLTDMGLTCNMGRTCTQEDVDKNIMNGWRVIKDPITGKATWNQPGDPLKGAEVLLGSGTDIDEVNIAYVKRSDSGGGSDDSSGETGRQKQIREAVKRKEIEVNQEYVQSISKNGKVDLTKAKDDGVSIIETAKINRAASVAAIGDRMKDMKKEGKIDKQEYDDMEEVDEQKAMESLLDAYKCGED
jgi:hypothetical protein